MYMLTFNPLSSPPLPTRSHPRRGQIITGVGGDGDVVGRPTESALGGAEEISGESSTLQLTGAGQGAYVGVAGEWGGIGYCLEEEGGGGVGSKTSYNLLVEG